MKHEEAIKLKPGTPILIRSKVAAVDATGDIVYETHAHDQEYEVMHARTDCRYAHLQTPEQKFDIYRQFKKGDIVKLVKRWGRGIPDIVPDKTYTGISNYPKYNEWIVEEAEISGMVKIRCDTKHVVWHHDLPFFYLELVTPAKELPYYIEETEYEYCVTIMVGERKDTPATYHKKMHPNAKEAAEAECTRLNEEWRKEQNND